MKYFKYFLLSSKIMLKENSVLPVKKDYFNINILPVFMKKIFQEMRNRLIGYVATNHNVPEIVPV